MKKVFGIAALVFIVAPALAFYFLLLPDIKKSFISKNGTETMATVVKRDSNSSSNEGRNYYIELKEYIDQITSSVSK